MKNQTKVLWGMAALAALVGAVLIWQNMRQAVVPPAVPERVLPLPAPPVAPPASAAAPQTSPTILHPVEAIPMPAAPGQPASHPSESADAQLRRALKAWFSAKDILHFLQLDDFVRHVVVTVDNLPREHASAALWPVNPIPGHFSTVAGEGHYPVEPTAIHPNNSARYTPFVSFVESIDTAKAVSLYVRFYPLFQQAYVDLGYPKGYFNDRLVAVIDHLLELPVQTAPLQVTHVAVKGLYPSLQPWVNYEFTDPALNALSAGQKMLLRSGRANHQRLKAKLAEFRAMLAGSAVTRPAAPAPAK